MDMRSFKDIWELKHSSIISSEYLIPETNDIDFLTYESPFVLLHFAQTMTGSNKTFNSEDYHKSWKPLVTPHQRLISIKW